MHQAFPIMSLIDNIIRPDVLALAAYHVPDSAGMVKLDAMENPYALPDSLRLALGNRLAEVALNRYPAPTYTALKAKICSKPGVPAGFDVLLSNGSDELISMVSEVCAKANDIEVFNAQAAVLREERGRLAAALSALPGVQVSPSAGNFLLVRLEKSRYHADNVFSRLLGHKVLVKNAGKMHALLNNCLRITVGGPEKTGCSLMH